MSYLKTATTKLSAPSPTPSNSSNSGAKRKRPDDGNTTVYSQPVETGTGNHAYTQLTYTIEFLKKDQRWHKQQDIFNYLNIQPGDTVTTTLLQLYRSNREGTRIQYDPKTQLYRYKPKYDIRSTAELLGYLQNQKSSLGLSVKDLKDGWQNAAEEIDKMEKKKEVLVTRHRRDDQVKTVWINDASLMYPMDAEFEADWHKISLPANPDDLRLKLLAAGLKPSSAKREVSTNKPKEKKRKAPRRGGKQTNTHMASILKDFSHLRK